MIDTDPNVLGPDDDALPAVATVNGDAVETTHASSPRRWPWLLALLTLCAIAGLFLFAIHSLREANVDQAELIEQTDASRQQIQRLEQDLARMAQEQQRLTQRLDSAGATNKVLREELLGMGERATMLEEAVARLAQSRLGGESSLRLNEAEFLLTMGSARLALYGDAISTIEAFSLAEDALAGLDDPSLATLRQTLAQELEQLRSMPADPRIAIRTELASLAGQLTTLAPADNTDTTDAHGTDAKESRLTQLLSRLVTVRRYDPQASLLGPSQRQAALATLALQLELAQVALNLPDEEAFRTALARVDEGMAGLFERDDQAVQHWHERLGQLREANLEPVLPALGATLRELRNLRVVRGVQSGPSRELPRLLNEQQPAAVDEAPVAPIETHPTTEKDEATPPHEHPEDEPELERSHGVHS